MMIECPQCTMICFELNDKYKPGHPVNGSMLTLLQTYAESGWSTCPLYETTEYANVVCPSCDAALLNDTGDVVRSVGPLPASPAKQQKQVACPVCDVGFNPRGLPGHIRHKHPEYEAVNA